MRHFWTENTTHNNSIITKAINAYGESANEIISLFLERTIANTRFSHITLKSPTGAYKGNT
jgi:hypothetical protein